MKRYFFLIPLFLFVSCSKTVTIKQLVTPNVKLPKSKNIAIKKFKNDNISQREHIASLLTNLKVDYKAYFRVVNRDNLGDILQEHKLQDIGVVGNGELNGDILEISSFVSGSVLSKNMSKSYSKQKVTDYSKCTLYSDKGICLLYKKKYVHCQTNVYSLSTHIALTSISNSKILFQQTYSKSRQIRHCSHDNIVLLHKQVVLNDLSLDIARTFVKDIAPYYTSLKVEILQDLDVEVTSKIKKLFESSIKALHKELFEESLEMFQKLNRETHNKSYVVLYNLALSLEGLGKIAQAKEYYHKAKKIAIFKGDGLDEILNSIQRIKNE